jgi:hypothetical protein
VGKEKLRSNLLCLGAATFVGGRAQSVSRSIKRGGRL